MIEPEYNIADQVIKRYYGYYPDGGHFGDCTDDLYRNDYNQKIAIEDFLVREGILIPWGNAGMVRLSSVGIDVVKKFDGKIENYLAYQAKESLKAMKEHELKIKADKSTILNNKWQIAFVILNILWTIGNIIFSISNYVT